MTHATSIQLGPELLAEGSSPRLRKRKSFDEPEVEADAGGIVACENDQMATTAAESLPFRMPDGGLDTETKPTICKAGWTDEEDALVQAAVRTFGTQWQAVADKIPGRTADAVRNRWHRLQKRGAVGAPSASALDASASSWKDQSVSAPKEDELSSVPVPALTVERSRSGMMSELHGPDAPSVERSSVVLGSDHGRARWSVEEDRAIEEGVRLYGCRWRQIAAMLPGRSDSSIRNRWHRLLPSRPTSLQRSGALPRAAPPLLPPPPPDASDASSDGGTLDVGYHPSWPQAAGAGSSPSPQPSDSEAHDAASALVSTAGHAAARSRRQGSHARSPSPSSSSSSPPPISPLQQPLSVPAGGATASTAAAALLVAFASQRLTPDDQAAADASAAVARAALTSPHAAHAEGNAVALEMSGC